MKFRFLMTVPEARRDSWHANARYVYTRAQRNPVKYPRERLLFEQYFTDHAWLSTVIRHKRYYT